MGRGLEDWLFDFLPGSRPAKAPRRWVSALKMIAAAFFCLLFTLLFLETLDGVATFRGVVVTEAAAPGRIQLSRIVVAAMAGFFAFVSLVHARRLLSGSSSKAT